jgi:predicted phosphoribosyltransferase
MFVDREDAGIQLGEALQKFEPEHPLLLGVARGGVEIGYYAALQLDCDFDVLIVRKLGYPQQPEAAFGAIAEDGSIYLDPSSDKYINKEIIERVQKKEKEEIKRRIEEYRQGRQLPDMENRVVIIVDDGIATGATLFAAIEMCHKKNPKKLIVAAPVSGKSRLSKLEEKLDELIVLEKRDRFFAVSEGYQKFSNLADDEVHHYMNLWRKASKEVKSDQ